MNTNLSSANIRLEAQREISLHDAAGVEVTCLSGQVWMTMQDDTRDITLSGGEQHTIERDGLTLVNAIEPSIVHFHAPPARATRAGLRRWMRQIWMFLVRAGEMRARRSLVQWGLSLNGERDSNGV